jgi:hypothetical protein
LTFSDVAGTDAINSGLPVTGLNLLILTLRSLVVASLANDVSLFFLALVALLTLESLTSTSLLINSLSFFL